MRKYREPEPRSLVSRTAQAILLLMGLIALVAIVASGSNYVHSIKSMGGLRLEITSLQLIDDDNPRAVICFRLHNPSPLAVKIERYDFFLYLNGERMGSSLSTYMGTDPNINRAAYKKALHIGQVLAPYQQLDLEFTLYIYSAQMEIFRRAQHSDSMSWSTDVTFHVIPPYAHEEDSVRLSASFEE